MIRTDEMNDGTISELRYTTICNFSFLSGKPMDDDPSEREIVNWEKDCAFDFFRHEALIDDGDYKHRQALRGQGYGVHNREMKLVQQTNENVMYRLNVMEKNIESLLEALNKQKPEVTYLFNFFQNHQLYSQWLISQ